MNELALLRDFVFAPDVVDLGDQDYGVLVFAVSAGIFGLIVITADYLYYYVTKRYRRVTINRPSLLRLNYVFPQALIMWLVWGLGAAVAAFIGATFEIVQLTAQSSMVVGITWPTVLTRIISSRNHPDDEQEVTEGET